MSQVEVITSVERRRGWTAEQKRAIVQEAEQPGNSISSVARKYDIHPNQLFKWRRLIELGALVAAGSEEAVVSLSEVKELKARVRELNNNTIPLEKLDLPRIILPPLMLVSPLNDRTPITGQATMLVFRLSRHHLPMLFSKFTGRLVSQRAMWSKLIVIPSPCFNLVSCIIQG
jgi:transposase-like protein